MSLLTYDDLIDLSEGELHLGKGDELRSFEELGVSDEAANRFAQHVTNMAVVMATAAGYGPMQVINTVASVAFRIGLVAGHEETF